MDVFCHNSDGSCDVSLFILHGLAFTNFSSSGIVQYLSFDFSILLLHKISITLFFFFSFDYDSQQVLNCRNLIGKYEEKDRYFYYNSLHHSY